MPKKIDPELKMLGLIIQKRRCQLDLSQLQLAEQCNVSPQYIELLEQGKKAPSFLHLCDISRSLNVTVRDLMWKLENQEYFEDP